MDNVGNQLSGRVALFLVCVTQCVCLGFDSNFLTLFLHVKMVGPLLLVGSCIFNGGILVGSLVTWLKGYSKWDVWACVFILLSLKVITLCILALNLVDLLFLSVIGCIGFCIGSEQSLILDLAIRRIPNPAKKLLLQLCFVGFALGNLVSGLFVEQFSPNSEDELIVVAGNRTMYHSNYKSFNVLQQFQIHLRQDSSYIIVSLAVLQCFLGYGVYDLLKRETVDSRPQTTEDEPVKSDYARNVEWISAGCAFFSNGLIVTFPFYVFSFALTDFSTLFFYAFLFGCFGGRLLLLVFSCKFPPTFWLCTSLIICGSSICLFSFQELRLFSPAIYGMSLSMISPSIIALLSKQKGSSIHPLICGSIISNLVYPLIVTQILQNYGSDLFLATNFCTLLIMIFFFVWLLNVQSITEKPQDENHAQIWIFFQGQGLKRANSVRKFITTFRESLRGAGRRRFHQRIPQAHSNLIENPLANTRTYRSVESSRKNQFLKLTRRLYNSIDDEPSSSVSLNPMINDDEPSQISYLEDD